MWLVAQLGVILHFYNPLVHWLAHRLRIEQELAADACGAAFAGGSKSYLTVLAQMALRQYDARPFWAGRPFFTSRGTLMRRIEMLHQQRFIAARPRSVVWPTAMLLALSLVGLGVSGLRGPARTARAADAVAEEKTSEPASPNVNDGLLPAFEHAYLPAETIAVMSIKPLKVANSKAAIQPTFLQFPQAFGIGFGTRNQVTDDPWEIAELKVVVLAPVPNAAPFSNDLASNSPSSDATPPDPPAVFIYRLLRPFDQSKIRVKIFGEAPDGVTELTLRGHPCLRATSEATGDVVNYLLVGDRTVVVVREKDIASVLAADSEGHPSWYKDWQDVADSPIAFGVDSQAVMAALPAPEKEPADVAEQWFDSLIEETALIMGHVGSTAGGLEFSATARCQSPEKTVATLESLRGLLDMGITMIPQLVEPSQLPKEYQSLDLGGSLSKALTSLSISTNVATNQLQADAKLDADFTTKFVDASDALLARQTEELAARAKEDDQVHIKKLGRLVEALNAYHTAHGHFPAAAVVGSDGATLHSWRVALLPYLGEQALYDSYKFDEPWDGEHNRQLVERIPAIYSTSESSRKGDSDYFVVTGNGTLFDGGAPSRRESMTDAAGETILVVQSRRQIPWTRPDDIDNSTDQSPFRLGRTLGRGFYAGFADGTVKFVPKVTDQATLRAMFTKAGGDAVKLR
jgi:hypothetical protein